MRTSTKTGKSSCKASPAVNAKKQAVVTVNLGNYDQPKPLKVRSKGWEHIMFTDNPKLKCRGWKMFHVEPKEDVKKQSREIKTLLHKFLPDYDRYIYLDASYSILRDLNGLAGQLNGDMFMIDHYSRNCAYRESQEVMRLGLDSRETVREQTGKYKKEGFPERYGLYSNGFFIRKNSPQANKICEAWYKEIEQHSYRDQLSLPYVLWKKKKKDVLSLPHRMLFKYLKLNPHNQQRPKRMVHRGRNSVPRSRRAMLADQIRAATRTAQKAKEVKPSEQPKTVQSNPKVHYIVPGRGDKNLGRAYNEACNLAGENDWICIRDGDTMFLQPYWPKQIEDIIAKHGGKYDLISCVTNRLGLKYQLLNGKVSEDPNILHHHDLAVKQYDTAYDTVVPSRKPTAGLFMLFPKKTWNKIKFKEGLMVNGGFIDWHFSNTIIKQGMQIGIARGIYIFHFYRFGQKNIRQYNHLVR